MRSQEQYEKWRTELYQMASSGFHRYGGKQLDPKSVRRKYIGILQERLNASVFDLMRIIPKRGLYKNHQDLYHSFLGGIFNLMSEITNCYNYHGLPIAQERDLLHVGRDNTDWWLDKQSFLLYLLNDYSLEEDIAYDEKTNINHYFNNMMMAHRNSLKAKAEEKEKIEQEKVIKAMKQAEDIEKQKLIDEFIELEKNKILEQEITLIQESLLETIDRLVEQKAIERLKNEINKF